MTSFLEQMPQRRGAESFAPGGSWREGPDDQPQLRARWVAQEFRGRGDRHEYFSETPDLAFVKAMIAHAARQTERSDTVVAVFDVRRAYCYAEEMRDTFVELPNNLPADVRATHVGKLRKALHDTRPAAASWGDELRKRLASCGIVVGAVSRCCFRNQTGSVAGAVHGDDIFAAGPREDDRKELHILNRTQPWCRDGLVFAADGRHAKGRAWAGQVRTRHVSSCCGRYV